MTGLHWRGLAVAILLGISTPLAAQTLRDSSRNDNLPVGRGQLPSSSITITVNYTNLQMIFIPLDERVLRLLTNDSYMAMQRLIGQYRRQLDSVVQAAGISTPGIAFVSFHATAPATRFDPHQLQVVVHGQQLQPGGWVPMSANFQNQQLDNREQVQALLVYDREIPVKESFSVTYLNATSDDWGNRLQRFDTERTRILGDRSVRDSIGHRP